jgi:hypothetical protein
MCVLLFFWGLSSIAQVMAKFEEEISRIQKASKDGCLRGGGGGEVARDGHGAEGGGVVLQSAPVVGDNWGHRRAQGVCDAC